MPRFTADSLSRSLESLLLAVGANPPAAAIVTEHLVSCHLAGHDSHGVIRIPQYANHVREGRLRLHSMPTIERETASTAKIDGGWTWGQVTAKFATDVAIAKAQKNGVAAVAVHNCYHVGRVGVYALQAAQLGLIAKIWCNGHGVARVAPWGGCDAKLATNPIAVAIPTEAEPILVDITTSVVAEGKVRVAKNKGIKVPDGWLLNKDGQTTNEPGDLYSGGTLLPFGGPVAHKGYGLSVLVDALGGILSGAGCGVMPGVAVGNGLLIEVLDPEAFEPRAAFLGRMQSYIEYLKNSAKRPGVAEILLPGEPERQIERGRKVDGFDVDEETWRQVCAVATDFGHTIEI